MAKLPWYFIQVKNEGQNGKLNLTVKFHWIYSIWLKVLPAYVWLTLPIRKPFDRWILNVMHTKCEHSLDPETFEMWDKVKASILENRSL